MSLSKLFTIGVYGYSENEFFEAINDARIKTFCDIRRRRGLRGPKYAFANSQHLQNRLEKMGIRYLHFIDLSPSQELVRMQGQVDQEKGVPRRERNELSKEFIEGFTREVLDDFDATSFIKRLGPNPGAVALFCVEGGPEACHRSLLAEKIANALKVTVEHLRPK